MKFLYLTIATILIHDLAIISALINRNAMITKRVVKNTSALYVSKRVGVDKNKPGLSLAVPGPSSILPAINRFKEYLWRFALGLIIQFLVIIKVIKPKTIKEETLASVM